MSGLAFAALVLCLHITAGDSQLTIFVEHSEINATVGGDALFSMRPSGNVSSGSWIFKGKTIAQWIGQSEILDNEYRSRAELFTSNGSLLLKSVSMLDSGKYRVYMVPTSGSQISATVTLRVTAQSPNFIIHVEHSQINVTEGGDALFSVRPSAGVSSGSWNFNGKTLAQWIGQTGIIDNVYTSRAELFTSNGSLLLKSVNMSDSGEYRVNMVPTSGSQTSATVTLRVTGESQQFTIIVEHSQINVTAGADALFSVRPPSSVSSGSWIFKGKTIAQWIGQTAILDTEYTSRAELFTSNGSLLLKSVNVWDSGEYRVTMVPTSGSQTSATVTLRVTGESQQFTIIVEHSQINVTAGGDALFSVRPSSSVSSGSWIFKGRTIAQWIGQTEILDNEYRSRAELFPHNGSLLLKSVNMSDSGEYRVNMVPANGAQAAATVTLRVTEPVSNVTVTSNATMLIEYSDTVRLTCSARGTDVSYLWLEENSAIIPGGRFELSADHSTLTVSGVLRTDGNFTCRASNLINNLTSDPLYLDVNYGPDLPHIITQPDSPFHVAGSTIRLTCFTESRPGAELNWQLNGAHLQSGQEVILDNISVSHTGKYTCEAYNRVTKRINASTTEIIVFGPVTGVAVVTNDSTPLENLDTIALSCDASGTVQTRTWFKDDQPIQENGRIFTFPDKAKLTIISVNRNDAGTYKCIASNSFSSGAGETYVQVYYGPEKVRIVPKRPVVSNIALNLTLACFALSVPWGIYAWYNGDNLLQTGQELTLVSVSSVDVGSYTCRVTNDVTKRNSYLTVHVTAQATKTDDNITLTTGAIVGIALGLLGMGLIGGVSGWLIARKTGRVKNSPPPQYETSSNFGRNGTLDTNTVNVSPSYVNFPRNEQGANNNVQGERHTYMTLNLGDRSAYSDLKR